MINTATATTNTLARPFLKWCGGKTKVISQYIQYLPKGLSDKSVTRYIEPFIGGGAMLFYILQKYPHIKEIYINDVNKDLMLTWETININVEGLIKVLSIVEKTYLNLNADDRQSFYENVRTTFNTQRDGEYRYSDRSAQMIFLNKTGFNGIYRVNKSGDFNVPHAKPKNPCICDAGNLRAVSHLLRSINTQILLGDYSKVMSAKSSDDSFIFLDPPYRPINKKAKNFTAYNEAGFQDSEQVKLRDCIAASPGKIMMSNSKPDDNFFESLYSQFNIYPIKAKRSVNSDATKRGEVDEILITNYLC